MSQFNVVQSCFSHLLKQPYVIDNSKAFHLSKQEAGDILRQSHFSVSLKSPPKKPKKHSILGKQYSYHKQALPGEFAKEAWNTEKLIRA